MITPQLEIYNLPHPILLYELKRAFSHLFRPCQKLQQFWHKQYPEGKNYLPVAAQNTQVSERRARNPLRASLPVEVLEGSQEFVKDLEQLASSSDGDWETVLKDILGEEPGREDGEFAGIEFDDMDDMVSAKLTFSCIQFTYGIVRVLWVLATRRGATCSRQ